MSWLYTAPLPLLALVVLITVLGALELGHRLARFAPIEEHQAANISNPILAIVGLLLAFSFSMASDRFTLRRAAAVEETNAIGTFWLRTTLLPEPIRSEMRSRIQRYVVLHFEHRRAGINEARIKQIEAELVRVEDALWELLDQDARSAPESTRRLLLTPALNSVIDDAAAAVAARENRLPDAIVVYLFFLIFVAGVVIGYRPSEEKRNVILWGLLLIVLGGVFMLLLDMDRPRRGLINSDLRPYVRLRDSLHIALPPD